MCIRDRGEGTLVGAVTGEALVGLRYVPLFDYFASEADERGAFRVLTADFVDTTDGTGIVHIAPGCGAEDFGLSKRYDLPVIAPLAARYGAGGARAPLGAAVHAWDLLNEPDWIVAEHHPNRRVPAPIPFDVLAAWVRAASATLRGRQAGAVTIGNARLRFAAWWDDPAFGFDFLQAHTYYDPEHDFDLLATPAAALKLTRPIVVGEYSARGDAADDARRRPALSAARLADEASTLGYAGAWPWSWRGVDSHGPLPHADLRDIRAALDA